MNRQILVGIVALALAGCAQTWPAAPPVARNGSRLPPVALTDLPNLYEVLNRENPRLDPASLRPENGPVLTNLGTVPVSRPFANGGAGGNAGGAGGADGPTPCVACRPDTGSAPAPVVPPPLANRSAHMRGASPGPVVAVAPRPDPVAPGQAMGAGVAMMPAAPAALSSAAALPPGPTTLPEGSVSTAPPAAETREGAPTRGFPPAGEPIVTAPKLPDAEVTQTSAAQGGVDLVSTPEPATTPAPTPGSAPEAIPLPGPELPPLPPGSDGTGAGANPGTGAPVAPVPLELAPASASLPPTAAEATPGQTLTTNGLTPELASAAPTGPAVTLELPPLPVPEAKDPPAPATAPGAAPLPAPPVSPPPAATDAPAPVPAPTTGAAADSGTRSKVDPQVAKAAADPTAMHAEGSPVKLTEAGHIVARVGDEVITLDELTAAVKERKEKLPGGYKPSHEEIKLLTSYVLDSLIERSTITQEAKRELKKPEQIKLLFSLADKAWKDEELPPLLRQFSVDNEYKLKEKFDALGKSYERMREVYRQEFLAQGFLSQKLKGKLTVTIPEMRAYYNAHIDDYNRPEQWTWREVIIELDKHPSRAAARTKAEAVLARLRRGDDFVKVAQEESEGPNRATGGLWETAPDSYAVESVNSALKSLPIGQVSPIIEGPLSYHLIRVDARRPAGPATFAEVQDRIRRIVHRQTVEKESKAFVEKLRSRTVVSTVFDNTSFAPRATRPAPAPAAGSESTP